MIVIQCILALTVFSAPLWVGYAFRRKTVGSAYLYGQVILWALFQVVAVPMIHLRLPFSVLWISFCIIAAGPDTGIACDPGSDEYVCIRHASG